MTKTLEYMRNPYPVSGHSAEWQFFRDYVNAALWSSCNDLGEPFIWDYVIEDLEPETLELMLADCAAFYDANKQHIHCAGAPLANDIAGSVAERAAAMAGHDFWLTRNRHGAGFWDGDWPEPHATALDKAAKAFGEVWLFVDADGKVYSCS